MIEKNELIRIEKKSVERYSNRFKELGVSSRALGWGCKEDQLERFNVIVKECDLMGKTIMDIGCGFADFYVYLKERNIEVDYIGVDINPDFVNYCKEKFPNQQFYKKNIMTHSEELPSADIVLSNGALNLKLDNISNFEYSKHFIKKAFEKTEEDLAIDFLSTYRTPDYPKEDFVYYHLPEEIFKFAISLTSNVRLIHNYKPIPQKEFMIILKK